MNYLIIGGAKSGKSHIGEEIALRLNKDKVIYIATMKPYDKEDEKRIEIHIKNREGLNFITIEKQRDIQDLIYKINNDDTVLLDSITSLLTNEMFLNDEIINKPSVKILNGINEILKKAKNTILISDYIFSDSIEYDKITENFRRELGMINRSLAKECDNVFECKFGIIKRHKFRGEEYEKTL